MEDLLKKMEAYATEHHVPILNIRGRAAFCQVLQEKKPQQILEIGTAIGYSTLLIAEAAAPGARITTLELSEDRAKLAHQFIGSSPYKEQIQILCGDAAEQLQTLTGPFDFVFIDAAKGQYLDYLNKVLPLLSETGVIVADNVLFRGYVRSQEKPPRRYKTIVKRLREYIDRVEHLPGFTTKIYENGDGLAVSWRKKDA